jgi:hypothetical protein
MKKKLVIVLGVVLVGASWMWAMHRYRLVDLGGSVRAKDLGAMTALYSSPILECNPQDPYTAGTFVVFDDIVASMLDTRTSCYIPEEILACTEKSLPYRKKASKATIKIGDTVEVLGFRTNAAREVFGLVRTPEGTYGWVANWHLADPAGNRMNTFR